MDITLYAYTFRSRAERIIWTLEELKLEYQLIRLNPLKGETKQPDFLSINPHAKVPALTYKGGAYTESLAIMEFLALEFDGGHLLPSTPQAAYHFRHALSYGMSELEAYLWLAEQGGRLNSLYQWPDGTQSKALALLEHKLQSVFDRLQHQPYMAGPHFSLADIYYYHILSWAQQTGLPVTEETCHYLSRLEGRPHFPLCIKNPTVKNHDSE